MTILITGAFGQLGFSLYNILNMNSDYNVIRTGRVIPKNNTGINLDIRNSVQIKEVLQSTQPDIIINLAAMTNVDSCEKYPQLASEINVAGVHYLCDAFSGKIIHLSTDYVFDGAMGPYLESDPTRPLSVYGKTKLASERILMDSNADNLVIRGNVLYDDNPYTKASFLNWVINSLSNGKTINIVKDQYCNPTWTKSMADIINLFISSNLNGIYHWADADYVNRFELSKKIAEKYELPSKLINPILTSDLNQIAPRPLKSGLVNDKVVNIFKVNPPTIDYCLDKIVN